MRRTLVIGGLLALLVAAPAASAATRTTLMPGVTYERAVQFTPHGPVAIHVVRGPRPTGLYALRPVLSNETIVGRETVTSMQKRLSPSATSVGINADLFAPDTGRPTGVLMRDGIVSSPPFGDRSSLGIAPDGNLDIRRIDFFGTWRGLGQRRALNDMNQAPGPNGISLFTDTYGPVTPRQAGVTEVVVAPLPAAAPNTDLVGPVVQAGAGGTPIPPGGAVLVARGTAAQRLAEEAPVGTPVTLRLIFRPEWTGILHAVGGGPVIVREGGPVFRANEAFTSSQLAPRHPRTAVGQLADGRVVLVVVDGRRSGYSVGMTNFELAQTMARLGAVTASAFDGGGSSTLAFEGTLLNRPSDRTERPVSNSLQLMYYGAFAPAVLPVISPNGDGVDETQRPLTYKLVQQSNVTATLTAPDGSVAFTETGPKPPGTYPVAFPPAPLDPLAPPVEPAAPAEGKWRLVVDATDDLGRVSKAVQEFSVNNTLGSAALSRRTLVLRKGGKQSIAAGVSLTRSARVLATVETAAGVRIAPIAVRDAAEGRLRVAWKGTVKSTFVYGGLYRIRFRARNELGTVELVTKPFRVIRAAPVKKKPQPPRG